MFNVNVLIHLSTAVFDKTFYCHFEALDFLFYIQYQMYCVFGWKITFIYFFAPHLVLTYSYNIFIYIFIPDILLQKLSKQALLLPETTQKSVLACRMGTRLTSFFSILSTVKIIQQ